MNEQVTVTGHGGEAGNLYAELDMDCDNLASDTSDPHHVSGVIARVEFLLWLTEVDLWRRTLKLWPEVSLSTLPT